MGVLRAFGDESGKEEDPNTDCISLATLIGNRAQWGVLCSLWDEMCQQHGIPYLHMKEIIQGRITGKGPFAKFLNGNELIRLLSDATNCVLMAGLHCRAVAVLTEDLNKVIKRHQLDCDQHAFCLYLNIVMLGTWALNEYPDDPSFDLFLDKVERGHRRVGAAEELYNSDNFSAWRGWPLVVPLGKNANSREHFELQAADLVAWSVRNEFKHLREWMRDIKPTLPPQSYERWSKSAEEWKLRELEQTSKSYPERRTFLIPWAILKDHRRLKEYIYDEERLENHIMRGRQAYPDHRTMVKTILRSGERPLTPSST